MSDLLARLADLAPIIPGLLGRILFHFDQVRRGKRTPLGWVLASEIMVAIPMGYIGHGIAEYLGLSGNQAFAAAISFAYIGPRLLESLFGKWLDKKGLGDAGEEDASPAKDPAKDPAAPVPAPAGNPIAEAIEVAKGIKEAVELGQEIAEAIKGKGLAGALAPPNKEPAT